MVKTPKTQDEDEAQSRRFIEEAERLAADGELNLTEAERQFREVFERAVPKKKKAAREASAAEVVDPKAEPKPT